MIIIDQIIQKIKILTILIAKTVCVCYNNFV